jgi:hypothetical protein
MRGKAVPFHGPVLSLSCGLRPLVGAAHSLEDYRDGKSETRRTSGGRAATMLVARCSSEKEKDVTYRRSETGRTSGGRAATMLVARCSSEKEEDLIYTNLRSTK